MIKFVGTAQQDKQALLFFHQSEGENNFFKVVASQNGYEFTDKANYIFVLNENQSEEQNYDWKSFRIAKIDYQYILTYKEAAKKNGTLLTAVSSDFLRWQKTGPIKGISETAAIVPNFTFQNKHVMYFGEKNIRIAFSTDMQDFVPENKTILMPRKSQFDSGDLEVGNAYSINDHILLTYYVKYPNGHYSVGAVIFDKTNPAEIAWRSDDPLFEQPDEASGQNVTPLGSAIINNQLILYWLIGDHNIYAVSCHIPTKNTGLKSKVYAKIIKKYENNPIIAPIPDHPWESRAAFNSAAIYEDGKVHFLYRALGDKDLSVLGYASSSNGFTIDERLDQPAYIPREAFETPGGHTFATFADHFASGGGYGGIEDPRITRVEDKVYLTYVAFDGATPPRAAMSSIHIDDFRKKNWEKWAKPKLISAPGMVNKSAVIFPRKVNGKYVVLHRVYPNILVDYLDDLEFNDYLQGHYFIPPRKKFWDSKKVGAGAPPMETKDGWLLIYQSVGYQDPSKYKIGAMVLDKNNPEKVLYRTHTPIIEPSERYENEGFKAGVVYPCGAVIMNNKLNIYYGGADTVVCAASTDLDHFLYQMKHHKEPKLRKVTSNQFN